MNREEYLLLSRRLVDLFYPLVEWTLFNEEGQVQEILNPFSSLKEDQAGEIKHSEMETPFFELLTTGKQVRTLIYPHYQGKKITYYVRFRYDLTHFKNLQEQLNILIQPLFLKENAPSWKESVDRMINDYLKENKISLQAVTAKEKRELLLKIQSQGWLDVKESSLYVASKLQISRATLYNYLKTASHLKKVHIHQVDAFTSEKFGGNPAGVVLDAEKLDEAMMRKIARELNLSETAFILPSQKGHFRLRYFTPTGHEVLFCGHSSVGALYMIAKERRFGMRREGKYAFDVETLCGILKMEVSINDKEEIQVAYETPSIELTETKISHEELAKAAGLDPSFLHPSFPVMVEKSNKDLFAVVRSLEDLKSIACDSRSLAQFSKQHDLVVVCLFCPETFAKENQFHMRCFAPLVGVPEDPFTGSVLGGLAAYVDRFGLLSKEEKSFRVEQGHFVGRPGVVRVEFIKKKGGYRVKVFAQAVHCFSTEMHLS